MYEGEAITRSHSWRGKVEMCRDRVVESGGVAETERATYSRVGDMPMARSASGVTRRQLMPRWPKTHQAKSAMESAANT